LLDNAADFVRFNGNAHVPIFGFLVRRQKFLVIANW